MGRTEVQAAVGRLIAALRTIYADGIVGAQLVIQGPPGGSPGDSEVAKAITIMTTVSTNTITAQQVIDLNAGLALIQSGAGVMATAILLAKAAIDTENAALRNQ